MKTQNPTPRTLPSPVRFSIYLLVVAAFCFANWTALRASDPSGAAAGTLEARLEAALEPVEESAIEIEAWMLNTSEFSAEAGIELEDWMLNTSEFSDEAGIELEDWMLNVPQDVYAEAEIGLEDWMLKVPAGDPDLEEWMVYIRTRVVPMLLATK